MANEELVQRGYIVEGRLKGERFGNLEQFNLGATSLMELISGGMLMVLPNKIDFPFTVFKPPAQVRRAKPDRVACRRYPEGLRPVAILEFKGPNGISTATKLLRAGEQALFYGIAMGLRVGGFTDGIATHYVNVPASVESAKVVYLEDNRDWTGAVVEDLNAETAGDVKDPTELAESVWQIIWHATKAEPKECLLTFVEIFMLKFLSDNLPTAALATQYRFESLLKDEKSFHDSYGKLPIDYYVSDIRPKIKSLFPDNTIADEPGLDSLFGLKLLVSKTSVINGFAFLKSSKESLSTFNEAFLEILERFNKFGPLTNIDPEFKLRLYETFLRRSARQQRLGQFFTPRNIVRPMIRMAQLSTLPDNAVVLDPAAGVGGFVLEPLLFPDSLPNNLTFNGKDATRRVKTIGIDVDTDLHILAKANTLLHHAEAVRDPAVTLEALNKAMAHTMVQMNEHEMLGSLYNPPQDAVDVILTNPPYVTQGSAVYRRALAEVNGARNGVSLKDYYDTGGLGVEALFLRYIYGALKKGGRAFVIVPLGLLNRSESRPKQKLLAECNILASIALPRKAFFNTAQPTYILALERRHTQVQSRPDVFCAIARSTGETLDSRRTPMPDDNDLATIAEAFVAWINGDKSAADASKLIKTQPASEFSASKRWDVPRFWDDDELVKLGVRVPPMDRGEFVEEATNTLSELVEELTKVKDELAALKPERTIRVRIGADKAPEADPTTTTCGEDAHENSPMFELRPGKRITHADVLAHPGDVPVYSCFTRSAAEKGRVSGAWIDSMTETKGFWRITEPTVTVNATGASGVGIVFVRENECVITDDVIAVVPKVPGIDPSYLATALSSVIAGGDFQYEAKLYQGRLSELTIEIPVTESGEFDLEMQRAIGQAVRRVEVLQDRLTDVGAWSRAARLT
jgi:type I restriction enzyme M protein